LKSNLVLHKTDLIRVPTCIIAPKPNCLNFIKTLYHLIFADVVPKIEIFNYSCNSPTSTP